MNLKDMNKVTIAIPTYNRKEYLQECLDSILKQTFQDFQIIVFDNASDYDVKTFLNNYNDKRIRLIGSEHNLGNLKNFERVFNYKYNSEFLVVFHDDDTMHPEFLQKELGQMLVGDSVVWVGSSLNFIKDGSKMGKFCKSSRNKNPITCKQPAELVRLILDDFDLAFDSVMYRTKYLEDISVYQEKFGKWCDRPYLAELSKKGRVVILKDKLINYRIHNSQDSQTKSNNEISMLFELYKYFKYFLPLPLTKNDAKLFYSFSTNMLISSSRAFCQDFVDYKKFTKEAADKKLFNLRYLNIRGIFYSFLVLKEIFIFRLRCILKKV